MENKIHRASHYCDDVAHIYVLIFSYFFWCMLFHAVAFFYFALQFADVFMLFPVDRRIYLFAALANVFNVVSGQLISLFISG